MSFLDNLPFVDAGDCKPRLRAMLLRGGMARWFDGKNTRTLSHIPALHRPVQRLPWPLSTMQAHLVGFALYEGELENPMDNPTFEHLYKKSEMEQAIDIFLRGATPDTQLFILED